MIVEQQRTGRAQQQAVESFFKVNHLNFGMVFSRGEQGRFVAQVGQVCPAETGRAAGQQAQTHITGQSQTA